MKMPFFWRKDKDAQANEGLIDPDREQGLHGPAPALGPDGKKFELELTDADKAELAEEEAAPELIGYRSFWEQSVARGLTPERLASILQETRRGDIRTFLELAEEMEERDPHYFAVLSTRKRAVARLRPSVDTEARGVDKKVVDAVQGLVEGPEFRAVLRHLMDALGKGFAVVEILWTFDDGMWKPGAYRRRDQKYFTFDYVSRSEVRLAAMGEIDGSPLPPAKFIVHTPEIKSGIPIRGGFAWIVAWSWVFKQYTLKDWVSFLDIFGMPIRVGKYHASATAEERRKLLSAVSRIAVDAAAIIPESMEIEFLESKGFADKPFQNMAEYLDKQMSKAILGQTMTTDGQAGGLAQAKVHDEVRIDILEDDAADAEVTINRDLIKWFVQFNFGADAKIPYVRFPVAEPQDIAVQATALAQLIPLGLKVSQQEVLDKIGFTMPDEGDEIMVPPAKAPAGGAQVDPDTSQAVRTAATARRQHGAGCGCGCGSRLAFNAEGVGAATVPDIIDRIGAEEAAEWEPQLSPLVEAILDAAAKASSYEEFNAALDALAAGLDADPLARRLAISAMKARGFGLGSGPNGRLDG